jgi:hypothetical protein
MRPVAHDHDPVRQLERLLLVVRHVDGRDPELTLDLADLLAQGDADLRVERGERLVEEEDLRLDRERACERDALLLATRQLVRVPAAAILEVDEAQQLGDPAPSRPGRPRTLQAERDVRGDGHVREQRVRLEHHADVPAARADDA